MTIDLSQFKQTFIEESLEGLDTMESALLNLDVGAADSDTINTIFRAAHSIKGGSATFGFSDVAGFTHVMETLLDEMRSGSRDVTRESVDLLLSSVDVLRGMIAALRDEAEIDVATVAAMQADLERLLSGKAGTASAATETTVLGVPASGHPAGWSIRFKPHSDMYQSGNDPVLMFRELTALGDLEVEVDYSGLPDFHQLHPEQAYLAWNIKLYAPVGEKQVREIFEWVEDECDLELAPLGRLSHPVAEPSIQADLTTTPPLVGLAEAPVVSAGAPVMAVPAPVVSVQAQVPAVANTAVRKQNAASGGEASSIRVGIEKVDALINMVGELVITQSMLSQLGDDFDIGKLEKLRNGLAQLERNTRELQENVMRIRMLPISFAFNRFPRMVHDLTQKLGKKVELRMSGENTELDKTVMEKIGDPLVHLVRNSLDHGVETPDRRRAAGKPETGIVHLHAYHQGGNILIEITDDGAGLNRERIVAKAIERGLIPSGEGMDAAAVYDLVFQPGFSTADVVSDVSGRGVGMDVVRRNIRELGGTVDVSSTPGKGSTFTIRLPLTLAILDGQLVRVGNEIYIIPLISIVESLQAQAGSLNAVAGKAEVYRLRDEYISIIRLYKLFECSSDSTDLTKGLLVVVEGDGRKVALFVDDLLGQQQVVIKSLESNYRRVEGVSGATILGDGTVALILDIGGLVRLSRNQMSSASPRAGDGVAA